MFKKEGKRQRAEMWRVRKGTLGQRVRKESRDQIMQDLTGDVNKIGFYVKYDAKLLEYFELLSEKA